MINGAHVVIYSRDAEADRAFFRDILGFASVDAGHGWPYLRTSNGRVGWPFILPRTIIGMNST